MDFTISIVPYRIGRAGGSLRGLTTYIYIYIYIYKNELRPGVDRLAFLLSPPLGAPPFLFNLSLLKVVQDFRSFLTTNFLGLHCYPIHLGEGRTLSSPRVTFAPQEGCPGYGQALEGLKGPINVEVAPNHVLDFY